MSRTAADIIEIGRDLIEVKRTIGHGNYLPWIEAEFGMSARTAQKFVQAAQSVGDKYEPSSHLPATVLYALASPATEETVREELQRRADAGQKVTPADVADLKRKLPPRIQRLADPRARGDAVDYGYVAGGRGRGAQ